MKIGVLGTGMVGQSIANGLIRSGHVVMMGSRASANEKAGMWAESNGPNASQGDFGQTAKFGVLLFNCTMGQYSLSALKAAGEENLSGKILVDVANPLDFSKSMPPSLFVSNTDSLGEQIQRSFPEVKVVKALNTISANLMTRPNLISESTSVFIAGDDDIAKGKTADILRQFGWTDIIDVGDITAARALEMYLPLWLRLFSSLENPIFNIKVASSQPAPGV